MSTPQTPQYHEIFLRDPYPGGMVCADCFMPTESEPCWEHVPFTQHEFESGDWQLVEDVDDRGRTFRSFEQVPR